MSLPRPLNSSYERRKVSDCDLGPQSGEPFRISPSRDHALRRLPRNMYDREAMLASLDRLEALEQSGARISFGHAPVFWRTVPQAPAPVG
jgi:hypothetical protein